MTSELDTERLSMIASTEPAQEVRKALKGACLEIEGLRARANDLAERYAQLLYNVERKFPGETRHETALRYIRQAENQQSNAASETAHD